MNIQRLIVLMVCLVAPTAVVFAEEAGSLGDENRQCAELITECFSLSGLDSANCFYSSGMHPFCDGTELGRLAVKRWNITPSKQGNMDGSQAFLGPSQLVDRECVAKFDTTWSQAIKKHNLSPEKISNLDSSLDKCRKELSVELTRP